MTSILLTVRYARGAAPVRGNAAVWTFMLSPDPLPQPGEGVLQYFQAGGASFAQSRGVMFFSFAYLLAESSIIWRSIALSGAIQSLTTFHCLPSHCWKRARPDPS